MAKLSHDERLVMWHYLSRARAFNDILIELKNKGVMYGPLLLGYGAEIIAVAAKIALQRYNIEHQSYFQISHRDQSWYVAHNTAPNTMSEDDLEWLLLLNHLTKKTSPTKGRDANIHCGSLRHRTIPFGVSHMGAYVPVAVGTALGLYLKEWQTVPSPDKRPIVISSFGDGAFAQGCVHEACNMTAALNAHLDETEWREFQKFASGIFKETSRPHGAPIMFVLNDNGYSLSANARESYGKADLSLRALGYTMIGMDVDSHDTDALVETFEEGIRNAQNLRSSLIIVSTDRLMGHNQTETIQYMDADRLVKGWENDSIGGYRYMSPKLKHEYRRGEFRVGRFAKLLIEEGLLTADAAAAEHETNTRELEALVERALQEPDPTSEDNKASLLFKPHTYSIPTIVKAEEKRKRMSYLEAVRYALGKSLELNHNVVVFGEDYASPKGDVFGLTRDLSKTFGAHRVWNTPISEEGILGLAHGLSFTGIKSFAGIQFAPFVSSAGTQLLYAIPTSYNHMSIPVGMVVLMPFGFGDGSGNEHSDSNEALAYNRLGWKIAFPANAYDAAGLLWAAQEDPNPVIMYLQIIAYSMAAFKREVPLEPFVIPFGMADIKKPVANGFKGKTVSVITYGAACVEATLNTATDIEQKEQMAVEVVDLRTIVPLDWDTVFDSARRNHRVVVFHEAYTQGSVSSDIAARVQETCYESLYGPIMRVCSMNMPVPSAKALEMDRLPYAFESDPKTNTQRIISPKLEQAIRFLMKF
ncbi:MAG: pyruvate/2-oxoglutarate dehydrogenase complex, dehydrogenase component beta subunit [Parcubacteria group bacterium Gr01-1014_29]|nr:MAG: pyruvate/2-oxoglutarate dehydrogenase complex, dehydrogenase component beta subunit [Parcubacteria group bacterium Gr01-1014_29]